MIKIGYFLKINKDYFGKGLKPIDLLIISQIEEFDRNGCICYMTDEQFVHITGAKRTAVKSHLKRLEDMQIISRHTETVFENGMVYKKRIIRLGRNYQQVISENDNTEVGKRPIKDNIKDNEKINVYLEETSSSKYISSATERYY